MIWMLEEKTQEGERQLKGLEAEQPGEWQYSF
jgi:hypothetical protein